MRVHPSRVAVGGVTFAALLSLAACVPSADTKTSDTLAPLALPPVTGSSVLAPGSDSTATTVALEQNSVVTLATLATLAPVGSTSTTATANSATNSTPGSYTVVAKDTLSGIGRRCAISPQQLADYNGWSDGISHAIYPGDVIDLPCAPSGGSGSTPSTATTTPVTTPVTSTTVAPGPGGTYTIVAGDYLAGIASRNGTTVAAIVEVNGWSDGAAHPIYPGDVINLPAKK